MFAVRVRSNVLSPVENLTSRFLKIKNQLVQANTKIRIVRRLDHHRCDHKERRRGAAPSSVTSFVYVHEVRFSCLHDYLQYA